MNTGKPKIFRRWLLALSGLLLLVIAVPLVFRISIDLTGFKGRVESSIARELGRKAVVNGNIRATTSLWPYFEIQDLSISNPEGFDDGDTAKMEQVRVTLGLLPLLQNRLHIRSIQVKGLSVNLNRDAAGEVNWKFTSLANPKAGQTGGDAPEGLPALAVDRLELEDISVLYRDDRNGREQAFTMEQATGSAGFGNPMTLTMNGAFSKFPFTLDIEANSLAEFLAMSHSRLRLDLDIAGTHFHFSGTGDQFAGGPVVELEMSIEGDSLDSLNQLLKVDLPPLKDYRLGGILKSTPGQLELNGVEARVKSSVLHGDIMVDDSGAVPGITAEFSSETIQLDDFDTGDWSPDHSEKPGEAAGQVSTSSVFEPAALSPETLSRVNIGLTVSVEEVLSGADKLGNGELAASLQDGRISIDTLQLQMGKSSLLLKASLEPGQNRSPSSLRVLAERFDLGALVRLRNPASAVGGELNLDLDISSDANSFREPLAGANGYFDFSGHPQNLSSKAVDLWAVNLLSAVVESSVKDGAPEVNCVISRWSLENGVMTARNLAVDTTRIRICVKGEVDFNQQNFKLRASPKAKRPEFFSLSTPLTVSGNFSDFNTGTDLGVLSIGTTAVRFAVSPVTTPLERLIRNDLPADGSDICSIPIGAHDADLESLPGC